MKVIRLSELLSVVRLPPNAEACPMVSVSLKQKKLAFVSWGPKKKERQKKLNTELKHLAFYFLKKGQMCFDNFTIYVCKRATRWRSGWRAPASQQEGGEKV